MTSVQIRIFTLRQFFKFISFHFSVVSLLKKRRNALKMFSSSQCFISRSRNNFNLLNLFTSTSTSVSESVSVSTLLLLRFSFNFADCKRLSNQYYIIASRWWWWWFSQRKYTYHTTATTMKNFIPKERISANQRNVINSNKNYVFAFLLLLASYIICCSIFNRID